MILLTLMLLTAAARAEEPENALILTGSFRTRAEANDRTDFASDRDFFSLRVRPEIRYRRDSSLSLVLEPQFARSFGEPAYLLGPSSATPTRQQLSGGTVDPALSVHEAYVLYRPVSWFVFQPGRQILSYGDELVVGAAEWGTVGRTFDAFRARIAYGDSGWSDLFYSKLVDNNTVAAGPGDVDLCGWYNSFSVGPWAKSADLYALYRHDASGPSPLDLGAFGARATGSGAGVDYRIEATQEAGTGTPDPSSAYQLDAEGGYTADLDSKPRLGLEYFTSGSGYDQLFPTSHKWLGYADVLGRRNVSGFVAHAAVKGGPGVVLRADYHFFKRTSLSAPAFKVNGTTPLGSAAGSASDRIGSEWDFAVSYQPSQPVVLMTGLSVFQPGDYLRDQFGTDVTPVFYYLEVQLRF